jgi:hypothetical protein
MTRSSNEEPIPFKMIPDEPAAHHYQQPTMLVAPAEVETVIDGPTLEQWVKAGYDGSRYPGHEAFARKRDHLRPPIEMEMADDAEHHDEEHLEVHDDEHGATHVPSVK